jgi:hypothetical protein
MSVVLLRCPFVPEIIHEGGTVFLYQHMTYTVLAWHKTKPKKNTKKEQNRDNHVLQKDLVSLNLSLLYFLIKVFEYFFYFFFRIELTYLFL